MPALHPRPPTLHRSGPALAALAALAAVLVLGFAAPASAHTALVSSDPAAGTTLSDPPESVTLTFSEPVGDPAYVVVTAPDGTPLSSGKAEVSGSEVSQDLAAGGAGDYTVAYRVVSDDGHPVEDEFGFTVEAASASPTPTASATTDSTATDSPTSGSTTAEPSAAGPTSASPATGSSDADGDNGSGGFGTGVLVGGLVAVIAVLAGALWIALRRRPDAEDRPEDPQPPA